MNSSEKKEHSKSSSKTIEQKLEAMGMEDYEIFLKRAYGSKDPDVCNDTDQEQEHNLLLDELQRQVTVKDDISKAKPLDQGSRKQSTHHTTNTTSTFSSPYDVKSSTPPLTSEYRSFPSYGVDSKSINLNNNVRTLNGGGGVTTITSNSLMSSCSSSSSSSSSHSANNNYSSSCDEQATKAFENDLQNNAYFTNEVSEISGSPYIRANLDSPPDTSSFHRPTTPTLHSYPFQLGDGKSVSSLLTNDRERTVQSHHQNSSQLHGLLDMGATANGGTGRGPDGAVGGIASLGGTMRGSNTGGGDNGDRLAKRNERLEKAQKKKASKAQLKETVVKAEDLPGYKGEETLETLLIFLEERNPHKGKKKDGGRKKDSRGKEKEALVKSASLDESHLNSNKKRSVASESSVAAGSSSSVAATMSPSPVLPVTMQPGNSKPQEKKKSSADNSTPTPSLTTEVASNSLVPQQSSNPGMSSGSVAAPSTDANFTAASASSGVMMNGARGALPSGNRNNFKKASSGEGPKGRSSFPDDERTAREEVLEAPFELVQNKKKKPRKSMTQREAETFSRGNANEQARREQSRARRNAGDRRKSVGSVPGSENESDDDSVRSLPAGECTPKERVPKQCSSSGGTPQTSYADIARISDGNRVVTPVLVPATTVNSFPALLAHLGRKPQHPPPVPTPATAASKDQTSMSCGSICPRPSSAFSGGVAESVAEIQSQSRGSTSAANALPSPASCPPTPISNVTRATTPSTSTTTTKKTVKNKASTAGGTEPASTFSDASHNQDCSHASPPVSAVTSESESVSNHATKRQGSSVSGGNTSASAKVYSNKKTGGSQGANSATGWDTSNSRQIERITSSSNHNTNLPSSTPTAAERLKSQDAPRSTPNSTSPGKVFIEDTTEFPDIIASLGKYANNHSMHNNSGTNNNNVTKKNTNNNLNVEESLKKSTVNNNNNNNNVTLKLKTNSSNQAEICENGIHGASNKNLLILTKSEQQQHFIQQSPQEVIVAVAKVETSDETASTSSNPTTTNAVAAAVPNGTAEETVSSPDSASNSTGRPRNSSMSSGGTTDMPVIFCGNNFEREIPVVREDLGFEFGFFDGMREDTDEPEGTTIVSVESVDDMDSPVELPEECRNLRGAAGGSDIMERTPKETEESRHHYDDGAGGDGVLELPAHSDIPSAEKTATDDMSVPPRGDKSPPLRTLSGIGRDSLLGTYRGPFPIQPDRRPPPQQYAPRAPRGGMSSGPTYRGPNRNGATSNPPVLMYPHFVPNASQQHMPQNAVAYGPHHPMMQIPAYATNAPPQAFAPGGPPPYGHPHPGGAHPQRGPAMVQSAPHPGSFMPPMMYSMHPAPANPPPMPPQPQGAADDGAASPGGIPTTGPHLLTAAQLQARFLCNPRMITTAPPPPPGSEGASTPAAPPITLAPNEAIVDGYPVQYQMQTVSIMMPVHNPANPITMMYCAPMPAIHIPTPPMEIESWMNTHVQRAYSLEQQGQLNMHRVDE